MKVKVFTRPVSVMLPNDVYEEIKTITDNKGISISDYIRTAIQQTLKENNITGRIYR